MAKFIMVQGTSSFAGKSLVAMALCRIFSEKGYSTAPFKAQNTSLNSYVTEDGGEIARAQAIQAFAAGVEPKVEMNPILIKPTGKGFSQVVALGKPLLNIRAKDYYSSFVPRKGVEIVKKALKKLDKEFDIVVMEGAGSPAEINLYHADLPNLLASRLANASVLLVADIERGGVFASIYGTVKLLPSEDAARIKGIIINRFRGDVEILKPGLEEIERLTGKKVLGVLPFIEGLLLPEEDSQGIKNRGGDIAVVRLPRISNFTDFDALLLDGIQVGFATSPEELDTARAVIIPGTKNTIEDLKWLKSRGFDEKIKEIAQEKLVFGICGGFQMLGRSIRDANGHESRGSLEGLGFFDMKTEFQPEKVLRRLRLQAKENLTGSSVMLEGYEIHMGRSSIREEPLFTSPEFSDGAIKGNVAGTYIHGVFDSGDFRRIFLERLSLKSTGMPLQKAWEDSIEKVARIFRESVDLDEIFRIAGL